ncbi:MAG TPA: glycosyltransferase [Elusimicrobiota bacterium]|nr:glycosyltransferase [Elusimicrobiota bacterium]
MFPVAALTAYLSILAVLSLYGFHRYWILFLYWRHYKSRAPLPTPPDPIEWPRVTVQLPLYNEFYVVERLLASVAALDYPSNKLQIQVLDDSTDESRALAERLVAEHRGRGLEIQHVARSDRRGFKAGALANGLKSATGEFVAIFDADFLPPADFLRRTLPWFVDPGLGMVQARWGHVNTGYSLLTRLQALLLDGHFLLEHTARNRSGAFFNFNGTAGVWRRRTIEEAGGWADDTLTEDLDISYRAQMTGWRFLFLPELVCPAELPVDMGAFRNQQHRWTKGALQVAKKILPALWKSPAPFFVKLESTVHLTSNLAYPLVLLFSLLLFPSLVARRALGWPLWVGAIELTAFALTTASLLLFYSVAQREAFGGPLRLRAKDLPALMAFGVGMCVNNGRAVFEAFFNVSTEFRRTAKFNIRKPGEAWLAKKYRSARPVGALELMVGGYLAAAMAWSLRAGYYWSLPFLSIFLAGYLYVGFLSLRHAFQRA